MQSVWVNFSLVRPFKNCAFIIIVSFVDTMHRGIRATEFYVSKKGENLEINLISDYQSL